MIFFPAFFRLENCGTVIRLSRRGDSHPGVFEGMAIGGRGEETDSRSKGIGRRDGRADVAEPGEIVVIDAGGAGPAIWGELATYSALQRKLAGVVIDGAIRDSPEIMALKFPAFSRLVMPNAGEPKGFGEIGVPVTVGNMRVEPGDWLLGDDDGVVVLPKAIAVEYANRSMDVLERENRIREEIKEGSTLSKVIELLRWEKK